MLVARRIAVGGLREFQRHHRPLRRDAQDMAEMIAPRLLGAQPDLDGDSRRAQHGEATAGNARIGIVDRGDDARDASRDDRLGAGRRRAVMRTGLERDVNRRAARRFPRLGERDLFGVRPAARLSDAAPDEQAIAHDQRGDAGIGGGETEAAPAQAQRRGHPALIVVARRRENHRAGARGRRGASPGPASGSLSNSPTIALKSRASRKLR